MYAARKQKIGRHVDTRHTPYIVMQQEQNCHIYDHDIELQMLSQGAPELYTASHPPYLLSYFCLMMKAAVGPSLAVAAAAVAGLGRPGRETERMQD